MRCKGQCRRHRGATAGWCLFDNSGRVGWTGLESEPSLLQAIVCRSEMEDNQTRTQ